MKNQILKKNLLYIVIIGMTLYQYAWSNPIDSVIKRFDVPTDRVVILSDNLPKINERNEWDVWQFSREIFTYIRFNEGSGRWWDVVIGKIDWNLMKIDYGICFTQSTIGNKTINYLARPEIDWYKEDSVGARYLIKWESILVDNDETSLSYGLMNNVYKFTNNVFELDTIMTCNEMNILINAYTSSKEIEGLVKSKKIKNKVALKMIDMLNRRRTIFGCR